MRPRPQRLYNQNEWVSLLHDQKTRIAGHSFLAGDRGDPAIFQLARPPSVRAQRVTVRMRLRLVTIHLLALIHQA